MNNGKCHLMTFFQSIGTYFTDYRYFLLVKDISHFLCLSAKKVFRCEKEDENLNTLQITFQHTVYCEQSFTCMYIFVHACTWFNVAIPKVVRFAKASDYKQLHVTKITYAWSWWMFSCRRHLGIKRHMFLYAELLTAGVIWRQGYARRSEP